MPNKDNDGPEIKIDLPAVYSQGGFVQVRTITLQTKLTGTLTSAANDHEDHVELRPAS